MTRKVYPPAMVAQLWANKAQETAQNSNKSFYFYEGTIYSYGTHFPIAKHVTNKHGESAVLFTTRNYSHSTSAHKSLVRRACRHLTMFNVNVGGGSEYSSCAIYGPHGTEAAWKAYLKEIKAAQLKQKRARTESARNHHTATIHNTIEEANAYAQFFGLRRRIENVEQVEEEKELLTV